MGAILEPDLYELLVWTAWFGVLGFLKMVCLLAKDRFEHLAAHPNTPRRDHTRILGLLLLILGADLCWFELCLFLFKEAGMSVILLLVVECLTLFLDFAQTLVKYTVHMVELVHEARVERIAAARAEARLFALVGGLDRVDATATARLVLFALV